MAELDLAFPKNEAGEREGLADAGIETFRDAPYASCAREAGQNARDAAAAVPVRMSFNVLQIEPDALPAHATLVEALASCASEAIQEKEKDFFQNALAVVRQSTIPVLEVADFNTKGLIGPPGVAGTPFHSLLKASGVSRKESDTAGGSFGIGKNASFAVSDLQFVMYSTVYADLEGADQFAAQGKIKLVSHPGPDGVMRRASGYWGNPTAFSAVTDPAAVPSWMRRTQRGTSLFCVGFRESDDWAQHMVASLLTNFFVAIHREEMTFQIDDKRFQINRNSVEHLLNSSEIRDAAQNAGQLLDLEFAGQLYRCLVSPSTETREIKLEGFGQVTVRILIQDGLPSRIGFIRNGMLITDNLRHFGQPLVRFPNSRDFIALVEPDEAANRLLKQLENPAHDGFSAQRIVDPAKRGAAESAMRRLGRRLRDLIRDTTGVPLQDSVVLEELARFFGDASPTSSSESPGTESNPEVYVYEPPKRQRPRPTVSTPTGGEAGGRPGTGTSAGDGDGGGTGALQGQGQGGLGHRGEQAAVVLRRLRNVTVGDGADSALSRRIMFESDATGSLRLSISATGLYVSEPLQIVRCEPGTVEGLDLVIDAVAGKRTVLDVTFAEPYAGPLDVVATTIVTASTE